MAARAVVACRCAVRTEGSVRVLLRASRDLLYVGGPALELAAESRHSCGHPVGDDLQLIASGAGVLSRVRSARGRTRATLVPGAEPGWLFVTAIRGRGQRATLILGVRSRVGP